MPKRVFAQFFHPPCHHASESAGSNVDAAFTSLITTVFNRIHGNNAGPKSVGDVVKLKDPKVADKDGCCN